MKAGHFNQMIGNGLIYDDGFDGVQFNAGKLLMVMVLKAVLLPIFMVKIQLINMITLPWCMLA